MIRSLLAASAATLSLAFSPVLAAPDVIPVRAEQSELVLAEAHSVMDSMMDMFLEAFTRAGIQNKVIKDELMANIDASITTFIAERTEKAHLESLMAYLSPEAQVAVHDFFETPGGVELAASLVRAGASVPTNPFTDEEHHQMMDLIFAGLEAEVEEGTLSARRAKRLARAIHDLDS